MTVSNKKPIYRWFIKRLLDLILSLIAVICLSPVLLIISLLIWIKLGKPVIFKQNRPGLNEKTFILYKFRTMSNERDENDKFLPDSIRLTKFGKFLRASSLDELPELINILKGDLSIVGPRPLAITYLPLYSFEERRRHSVRPGLTGWAQINGRNTIEWKKRFEYDCWYVDNLNFFLDLKIIYLTFVKVLKREGVLEGGTAEVESFNGNN